MVPGGRRKLDVGGKSCPAHAHNACFPDAGQHLFGGQGAPVREGVFPHGAASGSGWISTACTLPRVGWGISTIFFTTPVGRAVDVRPEPLFHGGDDLSLNHFLPGFDQGAWRVLRSARWTWRRAAPWAGGMGSMARPAERSLLEAGCTPPRLNVRRAALSMAGLVSFAYG